MTKLYEIANNIEQVINDGFVFDSETGEVFFTTDDLDQLDVDFKEKLSNCAIYVKNLKADIEAMKNERNTLSERIKVAENKTERLQSYMSDCMAVAEIDSVITPQAEIRRRKSSAVDIIDESLLPREFVKVTTTEKVDKIGIMKALKEGEEIPGAAIIERRKVSIK